MQKRNNWNFSSVTEGISRLEFFLKSVSVGVSGENSEFVHDLFMSIVDKIGLKRILAVCTDNASLLRKARQLSVNSHGYILNFRCIPHLLNLFLCDLVNHKALVNLLGKVSIIVSFFSK